MDDELNFKQLARRLGVRLDDLREALRQNPNLPDALTRKKPTSDEDTAFQDRTVPSTMLPELTAKADTIDNKLSSKKRIRRLELDSRGMFSQAFPPEAVATPSPGADDAPPAPEE